MGSGKKVERVVQSKDVELLPAAAHWTRSAWVLDSEILPADLLAGSCAGVVRTHATLDVLPNVLEVVLFAMLSGRTKRGK